MTPGSATHRASPLATPSEVLLPITDPDFKRRSPQLCRRLAPPGHPCPVRLPSTATGWMIADFDGVRDLLRSDQLSKRPPGHQARSIHPLYDNLVGLDPPRHTYLRQVLNQAMPSSLLRRCGEHIAPCADRLARDLVHACLDRDIDVVEHYALPLSLSTLIRLLGLPPGCDAELRQWSQRLHQADLESPERSADIAGELQDFIRQARHRTVAPQTSIIARLQRLNSRQVLSPDECDAMLFLLTMAGHETSVHLITSLIWRALTPSHTWHRLRQDPKQILPFAEEVLRLEPPLEFATPRFTLAPITIGQTILPEGAAVFLGIAAANRDTTRFPRPDRLVLTSTPRPSHLSFGSGHHTCPGATLARLQAHLALEALLRHGQHLALSPAPHLCPRWMPGMNERGLQHLFVHRRDDFSVPTRAAYSAPVLRP